MSSLAKSLYEQLGEVQAGFKQHGVHRICFSSGSECVAQPIVAILANGESQCCQHELAKNDEANLILPHCILR